MADQSKHKIKLIKINTEATIKSIGDFIIQKTLQTKKTGGVIGLSGGVDSTTVAAITIKAYKEHNKKNPNKQLELLGYILPSNTNKQQDTLDALNVAKKLGIRVETINIEPIIQIHRYTNPEAFNKDYDKGNMTSRIRANILNTKAATYNKIVIGTGNKDEDYSIGYYTLFGDGAVHINPIGELPKRLVKKIATSLGFKEISQKEPSAGLEPNQTDHTDLGYTYNTIELITTAINQGLNKKQLINHPNIIKQTKKDLKKLRKYTNHEAIINNILQRHKTAKQKNEILHPPTAKIITLPS